MHWPAPYPPRGSTLAIRGTSARTPHLDQWLGRALRYSWNAEGAVVNWLARLHFPQLDLAVTTPGDKSSTTRGAAIGAQLQHSQVVYVRARRRA
eukprot:scaffold78917_cov33-Tisochrysis_lutea.AAC.6